MSSTRNQKKPGAPAPERKAAPGPVLTPQVLLVLILVALIIGVAVYWSQVVKKSNETLAALDSRINTAKTQKDTYTKKKKKLEIARTLNTTVRDKLQTVTYMFLTDQDSMIPFWEDDFFPLLSASRLAAQSDEAEIKIKPYVFNINMAMKPFDTLPPGALFDDANKNFPISYHGEQGGVPEDTPLDTRPKDYLTPYTIKMEKFRGSYKNVRDFIETLQRKTDKVFYTVHCFANDKEKNVPTYRTTSEWSITLTVYFINPEASASGDDPPTPPGAESC